MRLPEGFGAGMLVGAAYQAFWHWYAPKLIALLRGRTP